MKKKEFNELLLNSGFDLGEYNTYLKTFGNVLIRVASHANIFGKVKLVVVFYKFKNELKEEFHDEVWNKAIELFKDSQGLELASLGFDHLESYIMDANLINCLDSNKINNYCQAFRDKVVGIITDYNV